MTVLKALGALAVVALGATTGYGVTVAVLATLGAAGAGADAAIDAHRTVTAAQPQGSNAVADTACCPEQTSAHPRPRGQQFPTEGLLGAAARGDVQAVRTLLDAGAAIDARDGEGRSPVVLAVLAGQMDVLRLLLDRGASTELADRDHRGPVQLAAGFGDTAMIDALIAYGAAPATADAQGRTALMVAAEGDHLEALELLLQHSVGALDRRCNDGRTALMYATIAARGAAVDRLLTAHAGTGIRDGRGATTLAIAAEYGRLELARRLLDAGAAIDAADHDGLTPLCYAALRQPQLAARAAVAELLATRGASFVLRLTEAARARVDLPALEALARRHGQRLELGLEPVQEAHEPLATRQILRAVPRQASRALPPRAEQRLMAFRNNHWRVANVVARVEVKNLQARPGQRVSLAGDAQGHQGIRLDDALLFESFHVGGRKLATDFLGRLQALRVDDEYAARGPAGTRFGPDELDVTRYFRGAQRLVVTAIDWGRGTQLSDVFLRVHGKDAESVLRFAEVRELP